MGGDGGGGGEEGGGAPPEAYRRGGESEGSSQEMADLERGKTVEEEESKTGKAGKDCRICHMPLMGSSPEPQLPIELGCSCKGDLAAAHKNCAETWFRIKGNRTCEICGATAKNVAPGEVPEPGNESSGELPPAAAAVERRRFWRGHRFVNFLLACMVFAFVISWLFHFNGPG
ncbi:RING/FYVE/PHD zinc finger superfamily protein [Wolffia australiana]